MRVNFGGSMVASGTAGIGAIELHEGLCRNADHCEQDDMRCHLTTNQQSQFVRHRPEIGADIDGVGGQQQHDDAGLLGATTELAASAVIAAFAPAGALCCSLGINGRHLLQRLPIRTHAAD